MGKSSIKNVRIYNAALSKREVQLLAEWERARQAFVTIGDIERKVGTVAAVEVARELVRKKALRRLRPGRYMVRPFRTLGRPNEPSTAVAVEGLLREQPHYLGGLWALSLHRLTEQRYDSVLDAFVTQRLASRVFGPGRVRFHALVPNAFTYGISTSTIEGVTVSVSDIERTILDALDHPRIFFGIARALDLTKAHLEGIDKNRLLAYAISGSKPSTCQRVGVLLQRAGFSRRTLAKLRSRARETNSLLSMDPDARRIGHVNRDWNVVENEA